MRAQFSILLQLFRASPLLLGVTILVACSEPIANINDTPNKPPFDKTKQEAKLSSSETYASLALSPLSLSLEALQVARGEAGRELSKCFNISSSQVTPNQKSYLISRKSVNCKNSKTAILKGSFELLVTSTDEGQITALELRTANYPGSSFPDHFTAETELTNYKHSFSEEVLQFSMLKSDEGYSLNATLRISSAITSKKSGKLSSEGTYEVNFNATLSSADDFKTLEQLILSNFNFELTSLFAKDSDKIFSRVLITPDEDISVNPITCALPQGNLKIHQHFEYKNGKKNLDYNNKLEIQNDQILSQISKGRQKIRYCNVGISNIAANAAFATLDLQKQIFSLD